jgi:hypothetical protein
MHCRRWRGWTMNTSSINDRFRIKTSRRISVGKVSSSFFFIQTGYVDRRGRGRTCGWNGSYYIRISYWLNQWLFCFTVVCIIIILMIVIIVVSLFFYFTTMTDCNSINIFWMPEKDRDFTMVDSPVTTNPRQSSHEASFTYPGQTCSMKCLIAFNMSSRPSSFISSSFSHLSRGKTVNVWLIRKT